jgi:hypothetical protein
MITGIQLGLFILLHKTNAGKPKKALIAVLRHQQGHCDGIIFQFFFLKFENSLRIPLKFD